MDLQIGKVQRKVVVIHFFHTNYAKYMVLLLRFPYNSAPGGGHRLANKTIFKAQHVHSKQSNTTKKSTVVQKTLIPSVSGLHSAFNDWVKKLGLLLSASRSK